MRAAADVDVQVFDAGDVSVFPEGKAIVAYCEEDGCNKGVRLRLVLFRAVLCSFFVFFFQPPARECTLVADPLHRLYDQLD